MLYRINIKTSHFRIRKEIEILIQQATFPDDPRPTYLLEIINHLRNFRATPRSALVIFQLLLLYIISSSCFRLSSSPVLTCSSCFRLSSSPVLTCSSCFRLSSSPVLACTSC